MSRLRKFTCKYGLISHQLLVKKNISFKITEKGIIKDLKYDECKKKLEISNSNEGFLLIPGFINSHVHIGDSFAKEVGFNKDLISVVAPPDGIKHVLLKNTSNAIKLMGIRQAMRDMISLGTTCFADFRERENEGIQLLKGAKENQKIETLILGRFQNPHIIRSIFKEGDGIGLVSYRRITDEMKSELQKNKKKYKKIIAVHCAEKERREKLIRALFDDDIIDVIIHGTQFNEEDLQKVNKHKKALVLCPRSNSYFQMGFPPILEIQKLKIPISLGTDNIMAVSPDLFEEMRYLYFISRALGKDNNITSFSAREILKMVTSNAAYNFKLDQRQGSIENGKFANFFLINLNDPNYFVSQLTAENIYPLLVQRTKPENIKKVYIRGELAFERN